MAKKKLNLDKYSSLISKELELSKKVNRFSKKDLADFLIQDIWGDEDFNKWPSLRCCVLDRVINILFDLDDKEKGIKKEIFSETPVEFINRLLKEK